MRRCGSLYYDSVLDDTERVVGVVASREETHKRTHTHTHTHTNNSRRPLSQVFMKLRDALWNETRRKIPEQQIRSTFSLLATRDRRARVTENTIK
mmetsp:Transcript_5645/g.12009  ORF Transcript_5645/g.12009 Transcript_5645/m.12009 type:complete len:95 (+) Transcript_5645:2121-2405(+)